MAKDKKTAASETPAQEKQQKKAVKIPMIAKITIGKVYGKIDKKAVIAAGADGLDILKVFGIIRKTGTVENKMPNGELSISTKFLGEFVAVNCATGVTVKAPKMFLPRIAEDLLNSSFSDGLEMQFGFIIKARYSESSNTAYQYELESLIEPAENDALSTMTAKLLPA